MAHPGGLPSTLPTILTILAIDVFSLPPESRKIQSFLPNPILFILFFLVNLNDPGWSCSFCLSLRALSPNERAPEDPGAQWNGEVEPSGCSFPTLRVLAGQVMGNL
jgi:hypothetical protein